MLLRNLNQSQGLRNRHRLIVEKMGDKVIEHKLNYIKTHQAELRADLYQGIEDVVVAEDVDASAVGRRFVLLLSFSGGPQIKVDLPRLSNQCAEDRPDTVARVFQIKFTQLLTNLKENKIFGEVLSDSVEHIRIVNEVVHTTFKSTCVALGLLNDDNKWHEALAEASNWASTTKLRHMYCTMLMFSDITNPVKLWECHWKSFTDDIQYRIRRDMRDNDLHLDNEDLKKLRLLKIEHILNRNGRSLKDFPPMPLPSSQGAQFVTNRLIIEKMEYDSASEKQLFNELHYGLNSDQVEVYDTIMNAYNFGSSTIAALLLLGGRTVHSRFKISINLDEFSSCSINQQTKLEKLIQEASLIIWDEAPMHYHYGFEFLIRNGSHALHDLIQAIHPKLSTRYSDSSYLKDCGILAPKNADIGELNVIMLSMLPGESRKYLSVDTICPAEGENIDEGMHPPELLHSLNFSGIPSHCLELKKGAPIMLLRNLNQSQGLRNGTRLIVEKMGDKVIEAQVITGSNIGEESSFHLYVALSRVTAPSSLKILIVNKVDQPSNYTKNVVYCDILNGI
ncbi:uncharacterized protein LOC114288143 [Camellia sinensis]|uniref:uncharacterized protein LOC114288143 n=1 Tax=Camellia sinensis TaxID=4442 RepID=UPI001035C80D|nr:uncharacterized protein LOC114288143 [Camellia sinensis]